MILGTLKPDRVQIGDGVEGRSLVDAVAVGERVHQVKHLEHGRGRLMDGADDGATFPG